MEKETLKNIIAFELEAACPDGTEINACAESIADRLGEGFVPSRCRVRNIVLDGLQVLESCFVEAEMELLASEITEALCSDEEDDEFADLEEEEDDE